MVFNSNHFSTPNKDLHKDKSLRWSHNEPKQTHRGEFSKDRDRILYSKSFLRMRGKTQVFMLQDNDHIRTRLTHTLEVNQIAKTIAIALCQNVELVEAIALGHDVGHTPFGHVGERTLCDILQKDKDTSDKKKGFKHNLQALRLLCELENGADYPRYKGLNLTKYVLWGISHHSSIARTSTKDNSSKDTIETEHPIYDNYLNKIKNYWSFEGYIVQLADEIAQRHHDIEDSLQFGILKRSAIIEKLKQFQGLFSRTDKLTFNKLTDGIDTLDNSVFSAVFSRLVVNLYVVNLINQTKANLRNLGQDFKIQSHDDFARVKSDISEDQYSKIVSFAPELQMLDSQFHEFLKTSVLSSYQAQAMDGKGEYIIRKLYSAFSNNPSQLPDAALIPFCEQTNTSFERSKIKEKLDENKEIMHRCIVDFIGGMTDRFAYDEYDRLYGTKF